MEKLQSQVSRAQDAVGKIASNQQSNIIFHFKW